MMTSSQRKRKALLTDDPTPQSWQRTHWNSAPYHAAAQQTFEFSKALAESGLLIDRQADIEIGGGRKISFSGFRILDESKLAQLDDKDFLSWREKGWLPFLYAHLFSGAQWQNLVKRLQAREKK